MLILNDFTFPSFIPNIHFMMFPFVKSTFDIKWNGVWWSSFVASNTIDFPLLIPYVSIRIYTLSYYVDIPFFLTSSGFGGICEHVLIPPSPCLWCTWWLWCRWWLEWRWLWWKTGSCLLQKLTWKFESTNTRKNNEIFMKITFLLL